MSFGEMRSLIQAGETNRIGSKEGMDLYKKMSRAEKEAACHMIYQHMMREYVDNDDFEGYGTLDTVDRLTGFSNVIEGTFSSAYRFEKCYTLFTSPVISESSFMYGYINHSHHGHFERNTVHSMTQGHPELYDKIVDASTPFDRLMAIIESWYQLHDGRDTDRLDEFIVDHRLYLYISSNYKCIDIIVDFDDDGTISALITNEWREPYHYRAAKRDKWTGRQTKLIKLAMSNEIFRERVLYSFHERESLIPMSMLFVLGSEGLDYRGLPPTQHRFAHAARKHYFGTGLFRHVTGGTSMKIMCKIKDVGGMWFDDLLRPLMTKKDFLEIKEDDA